MFSLPSQSRLLFIYDKKDSKIRDTLSSFSKLFSFTSYLYKNIDCLSDKEVLTSTMNKRKCKIAINCFSGDKNSDKYFLSFIRIVNDNIEFLRFEINSSRGFKSTGPIVGSRNIMFFKNMDQDTRSLFTDIFYTPSSHVDSRSLLNIVYIEKKQYYESNLHNQIRQQDKCDESSPPDIEKDDMAVNRGGGPLENQKVNQPGFILSLISSKDASEIGPTFLLSLVDSHLLPYSQKPTVKKTKNVKITEQRKSGRVYVPQQNLDGLKLKKGIFKNLRS